MAAVAIALNAAAESSTVLEEAAVKPLPLAPPLNVRGAELSGLAWFGDEVVVLPQYPRDAIFAINREAIHAAVAANNPAALESRQVAINAAALRNLLPHFEGFEAVAFHGDHAYFAIESEVGGVMSAHLVRGKVEGDLKRIALELDTLTEVPLPAQVFNMAIEALSIHDDQVLAFYEANGASLVNDAYVSVFDFNLKPQDSVPLPAIEYRLTDATAVDDEGRLWVSNYLWAGERGLLQSAPDNFVARFGNGKSHRGAEGVERLIELHATESGVFQTKTRPVYLNLDPKGGRNWEGIARLDDAGFLLVTDAHPATMLAFVPHEFPDTTQP